MDWLKELLGEELYKQVEAKVSASDKKIKLINSADGSYIPKEKFDQVNEQKKDLQQQVISLKDISTKYETLQTDVTKWKDQAEQVPALKKKMEEWETTAGDLQGKLSEANNQIESFDTKEKDYQNKLKDTQIRSSIEMTLMKNNAKHPELIGAKVDRTKLDVKDDGTVEGIDEQIEKLKESYADMFGEGSPNDPPNPPGGGGNNPKDPSKMTDEQWFNWKENKK